MASDSLPTGIMPSILDRLIDPDPEERRSRTGYELQDLVDAVQRDLENLLNTHRVYESIPEEWEELRHSVLVYGMPDFVSRTTQTDHDRSELGKIIVEIINVFEPRLRNVRVTLLDKGKEQRHIRFHVDAELNVDPAPEITFETILELTTGQTRIASVESKNE